MPQPSRALLLAEIDALVERGVRARATVQRAGDPAVVDAGAPSEVIGNQGLTDIVGAEFDDWSSQRNIVYDHAVVNRWKTDCLRFLRESWGADSEPYRAFGDVIERAGVLWRAIDPGIVLLEGLRGSTEVRNG